MDNIQYKIHSNILFNNYISTKYAHKFKKYIYYEILLQNN